MASSGIEIREVNNKKIYVNPDIKKAGKNNNREFKPLGTDKKDACDWQSGLKWTGVAFAILGLIVGLIGTLVYVGLLQVALTGIGTMSMATGLYTLLAGFGVTFITGILLTVACVLSRAKAAKEGEVDGDNKPWCANICSDKKAKRKESQSEL